MEIDRSDGLVY